MTKDPSPRPVPQPIPLDDLPPPPLPPELEPPTPSCLRLVQLMATGKLELAVIYKRSYLIEPGRGCRLADEQVPLVEEASPYDPVAPGVDPSFKSLPEIIGFKTGTDLVVQASARPLRPVSTHVVSVEIGAYRFRHSAEVLGRRFCDYVNGQPVFTPPETFEEIPLRYENAYGGRDRLYEQGFLKQLEKDADPKILRSYRAATNFLFGAIHPLMYPRNRFGKGYVLEDRREFIEGRELPNLERPEDRLTPQRLVVGNPFRWFQQPLPIGFDFFDPLSFPRSAMLGMPPQGSQSGANLPEVARGLVPADFCKGNIAATPADQVMGLLHPWCSRCASLGLCLPFLRGNEDIALSGMDPRHPLLHVMLPEERPRFTIRGLERAEVVLEPELHLVLINVAKNLLNLVWVGRTVLPRALAIGEDRKIESTIRVQMQKL